MDRFGVNDTHGAAVLDAFNECGCHSGTISRIDVGGILRDEIDQQKALNAMIMDINDSKKGKGVRFIKANLINMSFGQKRCNESSGVWYLPSKEELGLLLGANRKYQLGLPISGTYWSSTESDNILAWAINYTWGITTWKSYTYRIHLIRSVSYRDCN